MKLDIVDWDHELSQTSEDDYVGIKIKKLFELNQIGTYVTVMLPGEALTPHYHKEGLDEYHIISGEGQIYLSPINVAEKKFQPTCQPIKSRSSLAIPPNVIHQLVNNGKEPLTVLFICPCSHLSDDRYIVESFVGNDIIDE